MNKKTRQFIWGFFLSVTGTISMCESYEELLIELSFSNFLVMLIGLAISFRGVSLIENSL